MKEIYLVSLQSFQLPRKKYDKIAYALDEVNRKGYGIVTPSMDELILEEPEMVKQGSRFGVKLKATAPSIHIIRPKQILFFIHLAHFQAEVEIYF